MVDEAVEAKLTKVELVKGKATWSWRGGGKVLDAPDVKPQLTMLIGIRWHRWLCSFGLFWVVFGEVPIFCGSHGPPLQLVDHKPLKKTYPLSFFQGEMPQDHLRFRQTCGQLPSSTGNLVPWQSAEEDAAWRTEISKGQAEGSLWNCSIFIHAFVGVWFFCFLSVCNNIAVILLCFLDLFSAFVPFAVKGHKADGFGPCFCVVLSLFRQPFWVR